MAYAGRASAREGLARVENRNDYREVLADMDKAIELEPSAGYYYAHRARVREASGDLAGALSDYTRRIELDEGDSLQWSNYANRGNTYSRAERYPEAAQDFARAIKLQPDLYWLHLRIAGVYRKMNKTQEARAALEEAARLSNEAVRLAPNAYNYSSVAQVHADMGDYGAALKAVDQAIALNPKGSNYYVLRARVRRESGDLEGSSADSDKALGFDPKHAGAYIERGLTRLLLGRTVEAESDFKKCVEVDAMCAAEVEEKVGEIKRKRAGVRSPNSTDHRQ